METTKKPTLEQLKAMAYDAIANKEMWQRRLNDINTAIANYKPEVPETTSELAGTKSPYKDEMEKK